MEPRVSASNSLSEPARRILADYTAVNESSVGTLPAFGVEFHLSGAATSGCRNGRVRYFIL